jgi:hypothetical protein
VKCVYDIESAYPEDSKPTVKHLLGGGKCEAHLFIRYKPFIYCIHAFFLHLYPMINSVVII